MKSGKQRRAENKSKHRRRKQQPGASAKVSTGSEPSGERIPVNESLLAPNNSYGVPDFVTRGYYVDRPFRCVGCGKQEVWTATQQNGGTRWRKGLSISLRFVAAHAGTRSAPGARKRGAFIVRG